VASKDTAFLKVVRSAGRLLGIREGVLELICLPDKVVVLVGVRSTGCEWDAVDIRLGNATKVIGAAELICDIRGRFRVRPDGR
jgi:hypothetical protein